MTTKPRIAPDFPDITDFAPRKPAPAADPSEVRAAAEQAGFTSRQPPASETTTPEPSTTAPAPAPAPEPVPVPAATAPSAPRPPEPLDARTLRRTNKNARLNIATTQDVRDRFWGIAQRCGLTSGEDVLIALLNAYEARQAPADK